MIKLLKEMAREFQAKAEKQREKRLQKAKQKAQQQEQHAPQSANQGDRTFERLDSPSTNNFSSGSRRTRTDTFTFGPPDDLSTLPPTPFNFSGPSRAATGFHNAPTTVPSIPSRNVRRESHQTVEQASEDTRSPTNQKPSVSTNPTSFLLHAKGDVDSEAIPGLERIIKEPIVPKIDFDELMVYANQLCDAALDSVGKGSDSATHGWTTALEAEVKNFRECLKNGKSTLAIPEILQAQFTDDVKLLLDVVGPLPELQRFCKTGAVILRNLDEGLKNATASEQSRLIEKKESMSTRLMQSQQTLEMLEIPLKYWVKGYIEFLLKFVQEEVIMEMKHDLMRNQKEQAERDHGASKQLVEHLKNRIVLREGELHEAELSEKKSEQKHQSQLKKLENDLRVARQSLADEAAKRELRDSKAELQKVLHERAQDTLRSESMIANLKNELAEKGLRIQNQQASIEHLKAKKQGPKTMESTEVDNTAGYDALLYQRDSLQDQLSSVLNARQNDSERIRKLEFALESKQESLYHQAPPASDLMSKVEHLEGLVDSRRNELSATTIECDAVEREIAEVEAEIALLTQQVADEKAEKKKKQQDPKATHEEHEISSEAPSSPPEPSASKVKPIEDPFPALPPVARSQELGGGGRIGAGQTLKIVTKKGKKQQPA